MPYNLRPRKQATLADKPDPTAKKSRGPQKPPPKKTRRFTKAQIAEANRSDSSSSSSDEHEEDNWTIGLVPVPDMTEPAETAQNADPDISNVTDATISSIGAGQQEPASFSESESVSETPALTILQWNVKAITTRILDVRRAAAEHQPDLILLQETSLKKNQSTPKIRNYFASRCDRAVQGASHGSVGGGLLLYIRKKNDIPSYSVTNTPGEKNVRTALQTAILEAYGNRIAIQNCYRNNPCVGADYQIAFDDLAQEHELVIIAGDLNSPSKAQGYHLGHRVTDDGRRYDEWLGPSAFVTSEFGNTHYNASRKTWTKPDICLVTQPLAQRTTSTVLPISGSDHRPILHTVQLDRFEKPSTVLDFDRKAWNFRKANRSKFRQSLEHRLAQHWNDGDGTGQKASTIVSALLGAAETAIPCGAYLHTPKPLSESELEAQAIEQAIDDATCTDDSDVAERLSELQAQLADANRATQKSTMADFIEADPWKAMRALRKPNTASEDERPDIAAINENFRKISSHENREALALQRLQLLAKLDSFESRVAHNPLTSMARDYTIDEVTWALGDLKLKKAAGYDGIKAEHLRLAVDSPVFVEKVRTLFNEALRKPPRLWKKALLFPIAKPRRCPEDAIAYRPIALLSILYKAWEAVLARRITHHFAINHLDTKLKSQFGFLPGRGTMNALTYIYERIRRARQRGKILMVCSLDFSKAFDKAPINVIVDKLMALTRDPTLCRLILQLNQHRKISTIDALGNRSPFQEVNTGVAQGSKLSTLLFITLVHDLLDGLDGVGVQYADDVTLFFEGDDYESIVTQQLAAMEKIQKWCTDNCMLLNEQKSFYQFFCTKKAPKPASSTPYGQKTEALKVLGCYLDSVQEARALKEKLVATETSLNRLSYARMSPDCKRKFYVAVAEAQIRYSAVALNGGAINNKRLLQQITTNAKRACCRVTSAFRTCKPDRAFSIAAVQDPLALLRASYHNVLANMQHIKLWRELTSVYVPRRLHTEHLQPPSRRFQELNEDLNLAGKVPDPRPPCHWKYGQILPRHTFPDGPAKADDVRKRVDAICRNPNGGNICWVDASIVTSKSRNTVAAGATVLWRIARDTDRSTTVAQDTQVFSIDHVTTVDEAETHALCAAVRLASASTAPLTIFSDSMSALKSAQGRKVTTPAAHTLHGLLQRFPNVTLAHCPAHQSIEGNEAAHRLAITEAKQTLAQRNRKQSHPSRITHAQYMSLIKEHHLNEYDKQNHPFFEFKDSFKHIQILARLFTEACKLNHYLHRIGKRANPYCDFCPGIEETVEHFVEKCPKWRHLRGPIKKNKTPAALADFAFQTGREL